MSTLKRRWGIIQWHVLYPVVRWESEGGKGPVRWTTKRQAMAYASGASDAGHDASVRDRWLDGWSLARKGKPPRNWFYRANAATEYEIAKW